MLRDKSEVDEIHKENLGRLSAMSHEERMREREELLSSLSEEQIAFIRSLRKGGGKSAKGGSEVEYEKVTPMDCSDVLEVEERRMGEEGGGGSMASETREKINEGGNRGKEAMKENKTQGTESHTTREEDSTARSREKEMQIELAKEEVEMEDTSTQSDLPISPKEARQWVHMDKVGNGAWL